MTIRTRISLTLAALLVPAAVAAVAPSNVTGIKATVQNGKVSVSWNPVTTQTIVAYRIYFSHKSILQSNGLYDDYETVAGTVSTATLQNTPPTQQLFVSVLAVNDKGEESAYFAEEASVALGAPGQAASAASSANNSAPVILTASSAASEVMLRISSSSAPADSAATQTDIVQQLIKAEADSATGVTLIFSQLVTIDQATAANAISIKTASGKVLPLKRLVIQGKTVTVESGVKQERGVVYIVTLGAGVGGKDANGNTVALDQTQAPMIFAGHATGMTPVKEMPGQTGGEVSGLTLRAESEGQGFYTVTASWKLPAGSSISAIKVSQTTDNGKTYGNATSLSSTTGGVSIPHVPAGKYGLLVQVAYDNALTKGTLKLITLPGKVTGTTQGSVLPPKGTSTGLPNSGVSVGLSVSLAGGLLGYMLMRRRNLAHA